MSTPGGVVAEIVYTVIVQIFSQPLSERKVVKETPEITEIIECLGSNSLEDLSRAIYCVNDHTRVYNCHEEDRSGGVGNNVNNNGDNNGHRNGISQFRQRDSYFFIEDQLYVEEGTPNEEAIQGRTKKIIRDRLKIKALEIEKKKNKAKYNKKNKRKKKKKVEGIFGEISESSENEEEEVGEEDHRPIPMRAQPEVKIQDIFMQVGKEYDFFHGNQTNKHIYCTYICQHKYVS